MDNQKNGQEQQGILGHRLQDAAMKAIKDVDAKAAIDSARKDIIAKSQSPSDKNTVYISAVAGLAQKEARRAGIDPRSVHVGMDSPLMKLSNRDLYDRAVQWTAIARYMNDKNQASVRMGDKILTREEVATRAVAYGHAGAIREISNGKASSLSLDNNERRGSGLSALLSGDREKQDRLGKDVTADVEKGVSQKEIADNARSIFQQSLDDLHSTEQQGHSLKV